MEGMTPLVVGTLLAIAALLLVLAPLVSSSEPTPLSDADKRNNDSRIADEEEQGSAMAALREIEFDRETGKLSDTDYADLKQRYTRAALEELRGDGSAAQSPVPPAPPVADEAEPAPALVVAAAASTFSIDDAVEAAIARARESRRACESCGPRPEIDATFCSNCGKYLPGACDRCGVSVQPAGSSYCMQCGNKLAA